MSNRRSLITLASFLVGFLAAASAAYWWLAVDAPDNRAVVVSGSMAPRLLGPHFRVSCIDCGWVFHCSREQAPSNSLVVCPLCGKRQANADRPLAGDRVHINRQAFDRAEPERWRVTAFRRQTEAGERWEVKRVAGLPHEAVAIRRGDIFINGKRQRKTTAQALSLAVLVHDSTYRPSDPKLPPRWSETQSESDASDGRVTLRYQHWRCVESPLPRTSPAPIMDSYAENQALSRRLNLARDLILECEFAAPSPRVTLRLNTLGHTIEGDWEPSNSVGRLSIDGMQVGQATFETLDAPNRSVEFLRLAALDGRAILSLGEQEITALLDEPSDWRPAAEPAAVVIDRADRQRLKAMRLYRDLHYLPPTEGATEWSIQLSANEFLLLGDNVPVSSDGRQHGATPRAAILGSVEKIERQR